MLLTETIAEETEKVRIADTEMFVNFDFFC